MDDRNVQSVDIATLHSTDADLHNSRDIAKLPNDEREATELGALDLAPVNALDDPSDVPVVDNAAGSPVPVQPHPPKPRVRHWHDGIQAFWKHYIHLAVPSKDCRDHLANERTFLAYQRTSLALSMIGIVTAQLFHLQRATTKHASHGYFALGKPLAAVFQIAAILVAAIGAHRFWRQQMNMSRGKVWAGGWEVYVIMATMLLLLTLVFTLLIAANVTVEF